MPDNADGSKILSYAVFQLRPDDDRAIGLYHNAVPAVLRADLTLFSKWTVVIHHDKSLLEHPYGRVLVAAERRKLLRLRLQPETQELCRGMFWRMRPFWFEEGVEIIACRDMDSLPLARGRIALEAFVASDAWVHCLLDNNAHAGLMGGMAAYRAPALRKLFPEGWEEFNAKDLTLDWATHGADQIFLGRIVWPQVAEKALTHQLHGRATSDLPLKEIPDVSQNVLIDADKLAPYIGAAGFDVQRAIEFYDQQPQTEVLRELEKEAGWCQDRGRSVVISSDLSPDYHFFLPLVTALWTRRIGFDVSMLLVGNPLEWESDRCASIAMRRAMEIGAKPKFLSVDGYRTSTVAQTARLFGFMACPEAHHVITSDVDMWPLDKGWLEQSERRFTVLFSNAYGGTRWPICYLRGERAAWNEIMQPGSANISEAVKQLFDARLGKDASSDANWNFDEIIFAEKLRAWGGFDGTHMVERGRAPRGMARLDRCETNVASWSLPTSIDGLIDSHVGRPGFSDYNWNRYLPVFRMALGDEWAAWAEDYRREYIQYASPSAVARTP